MNTLSMPATLTAPGQVAVRRDYAVDRVLEYTRGFAALWVFMFHIADMFKPISTALYTFAMHGNSGVPLFFAISGYCMFASASSVIAKGASPGSFLQRRLVRVMPPFWLSILVGIGMPFMIALISMAKSGRFEFPLTEWMAFSAVDWAQLFTLTRGTFQQFPHPHEAYSAVNPVYWTLAVELQFYLVMAVALYFRAAWTRVILVVLAIGLAVVLFGVSTRIEFLPYWPAFVAGMALRLAHVRGWTPALVFGPRELACSAVAAVVIMALVLGQTTGTAALLDGQPPSKYVSFAIIAVISAIVLWLLGGIEHAASPNLAQVGALVLAPLRWLGLSSYSLYLLHMVVYPLPEMFVRQLIPAESLLYPVVTIVATAVLCYGFYKVAEVPFQHGGRFNRR